MEREVGGGIGMGNTCKPMAVSFQCMTKSTIIKKKKKKKINLDLPRTANSKFPEVKATCGKILTLLQRDDGQDSLS